MSDKDALISVLIDPFIVILRALDSIGADILTTEEEEAVKRVKDILGFCVTDGNQHTSLPQK